MKNSWLFIVALIIFSCKKETSVDYAILSGNIANMVGKLTVISTDKTVRKDINVLQDGNFIDTLRVKTGTYIVYDGNNVFKVYIDAGSNININYDAIDIENTLTITGVGSEISDYLLKVSTNEKKIKGKRNDIYLLEENEYKAKLSEIKKTSEDILANYAGLTDEFKEKEKRNLIYIYLEYLNNYENYHAHYAKKTDFKVSEGFLKELENIDYDNERDFLFSQSYKSLVNSHYNKKAAKLAEKDSIATDIAFLKVVASIPSETMKNSLLFGSAIYGVTYTEDLETYYNLFMEASTNEENKKVITESYNKLKVVSKGQPSPKFVDYENFAGGTTSLDDLKGKYVYIDVWATWCGPCKREIPFLQKIEKQYHGKNIEFVSLSIDDISDHDKWKKMVEEKQLSGVQLFADKSWESDFVTGYLIKGIPRFILIDPNGNIVNYNAPRPSSSKLIDLFNELNI